jgi:hypothetical protein
MEHKFSGEFLDPTCGPMPTKKYLTSFGKPSSCLRNNILIVIYLRLEQMIYKKQIFFLVFDGIFP